MQAARSQPIRGQMCAHFKGLIKGCQVAHVVLGLIGCISQAQLQPLPPLVGL